MPKVLHYNSIYFVSMRIAPEIYEMFVYKHIETMNMLKSSHFSGKLQTSRVNNSRIRRIKNAKFSGYCFHVNPNAVRFLKCLKFLSFF